MDDTDNKLDCLVCGQEFSCADLLENHTILRHPKLGDKVGSCSVCNEDFSNLRRYRVHMAKEHSQRQGFKCFSCSKIVKDWDDFLAHRRQHRVEKMALRCKECDKLFKKRSDLESHLVTHSKKKLFKCFCSREFKHAMSLKKHIKFSHRGERWKCDVCGKQFIDYNAFKGHMDDHSGTKAWKCEVCGKEYSRRISYNYHRRHAHMTEEDKAKFICTICGVKHRNQESLKHHIDKHAWPADYKPFTCLICNKEFMTKATASRHLSREHDIKDTNENIHYKPLPGGSGMDESSNHFTTNTDGEIHSDKETKDGLNRSPTTDDVEGIYECPVCQRAVSRKKSIMSHLKNLHNLKVPKDFWNEVCQLCVKKFTCYEQFESYSCMICGERHTQKVNIEKHINKFHKKERNLMWWDAVKKLVDDVLFIDRKSSSAEESPEKKPSVAGLDTSNRESTTVKVETNDALVPSSSTKESSKLDAEETVPGRDNKDQDYLCPVCDKALHFRKSMVRHMKNQHKLVFPRSLWTQIKINSLTSCMRSTKEGTMCCIFCEVCHPNKKDMNRHVLNNHSAGRLLIERKLLKELAQKTSIVEMASEAVALNNIKDEELGDECVDNNVSLSINSDLVEKDDDDNNDSPDVPRTSKKSPNVSPILSSLSTLMSVKSKLNERTNGASEQALVTVETDTAMVVNDIKMEPGTPEIPVEQGNTDDDFPSSPTHFPSPPAVKRKRLSRESGSSEGPQEEPLTKQVLLDPNNFNLVAKLREKVFSFKDSSSSHVTNSDDGDGEDSNSSQISNSIANYSIAPGLSTDVGDAIKPGLSTDISSGNFPSDTAMYNCPNCDTDLNGSDEYETHKKTCLPDTAVTTTTTNVYSCTYCQQAFTNAKLYMIHCKKCKLKPKESFPCSICERNLSSRNILQKHILTHSEVKPYK